MSEGKKVYCKDCQYCGANSINPHVFPSAGNALCGVPDVKTDTFFEQVGPDPRLLNSLNDCPHYKEKTVVRVVDPPQAVLVNCSHFQYISAEALKEKMGRWWFTFCSKKWRVEVCGICGKRIYDLDLYQNVGWGP